MIVSFHPCIEIGIQSIIHAQQLTREQVDLIKCASAIILPQGITPDIYHCCRKTCKNVFPNYDHRFPGEGKVGDAILCKHFRLPHPRTEVYGRVEHFIEKHLKKGHPLPFKYPFVLKANQGGEGNMVFLIKGENELTERVFLLIDSQEHARYPGMVVQEYINTGGKDLRVIVIHRKRFYFWRIQPDPMKWKTNVSEGSVIDFNVAPATREAIGWYLEPFLKKTGINLAAIDVLFRNEKPLFLEINYYFGRRALGGSDRFYSILRDEVEHWLTSVVGPHWAEYNEW